MLASTVVSPKVRRARLVWGITQELFAWALAIWVALHLWNNQPIAGVTFVFVVGGLKLLVPVIITAMEVVDFHSTGLDQLEAAEAAHWREIQSNTIATTGTATATNIQNCSAENTRCTNDPDAGITRTPNS